MYINDLIDYNDRLKRIMLYLTFNFSRIFLYIFAIGIVYTTFTSLSVYCSKKLET